MDAQRARTDTTVKTSLLLIMTTTGGKETAPRIGRVGSGTTGAAAS